MLNASRFMPHKLFFFLPPSKACLGLFVLQKPEGIEPFAGTIQLNLASGRRPASAMRLSLPACFLPLAGMKGRLPGHSLLPFLASSSQGPEMGPKGKSGSGNSPWVCHLHYTGRKTEAGSSFRSPFSLTLGDPREDLNYLLLFSSSHQFYFCGVGKSRSTHGLSCALRGDQLDYQLSPQHEGHDSCFIKRETEGLLGGSV